MGNLVTGPLFDIERETHDLHCGQYLTTGFRDEMEEFGDHCRTICHFEQMRPDTRHRDKEYPAYFAVFDGHSGHRCGEYVREHLGGLITGNPNFPHDIPKALKEAFVEMDLQFLREVADPLGIDDGCTATVVILWEDTLYVANSGDSRAVVCEALTEDHSPSRPDEQARIESYGGSVKKDRINGRLAVSRGFGALKYKNKKTFGPKFVTVDPDITVFPITVDTEFLVLATDGIFDRIPNEELVELLYDRLSSRSVSSMYHSDPSRYIYEICLDITRVASERGSKDNMTLMVVTFDHKEGIPKLSNKSDFIADDSSDTFNTDISSDSGSDIVYESFDAE